MRLKTFGLICLMLIGLCVGCYGCNANQAMSFEQLQQMSQDAMDIANAADANVVKIRKASEKTAKDLADTRAELAEAATPELVASLNAKIKGFEGQITTFATDLKESEAERDEWKAHAEKVNSGIQGAADGTDAALTVTGTVLPIALPGYGTAIGAIVLLLKSWHRTNINARAMQSMAKTIASETNSGGAGKFDASSSQAIAELRANDLAAGVTDRDVKLAMAA